MTHVVPELVGTLLAGVGLLFLGLEVLGNSLRPLATTRVRRLVGGWTGRPMVSGLVGVGAGALLQSSTAITFVLIGMVTSDVITVGNALPLVLWSNLGGTVPIFAALLDLHLVVLYVLGATALGLAFGRPRRHQHVLGAVFGVALVLHGVHLLGAGALPLREAGWARALLAHTRDSSALAFLFGAGLAFVAQSSTAITIVAITMTRTGVMVVDQTIMMIYGANLGSALFKMVLNASLRGPAKQLARSQDMFKICCTLIFVPLFYLETLGGVPLVKALAARLAGPLEAQMALVFVVLNLGTALVMSPFLAPLEALMVRLYPSGPRGVAARDAA
ncbi:MAG: Na/Pi symporter [Candidatus Binatia bacterium]